MASAGFAGSLVVSAGWKGRNLNKGLADSKRRVSGFSRALKVAAAGAISGFAAYKVGSGLLEIARFSKGGSKAYNTLQSAFLKLKNVLAKILEGPSKAIFTWLADVVNKTAEWLEKCGSIRGVFSEIGKYLTSTLTSAVTTIVKLFRELWSYLTIDVPDFWKGLFSSSAPADAWYKNQNPKKKPAQQEQAQLELSTQNFRDAYNEASGTFSWAVAGGSE